MLRIAGIVEESVVDGPGIRTAIFFQGCEHHCKGCHNPHTWNMDGGYLVKREEILTRIKNNPIISGVTLTGGDPLFQAYEALMIAKAVKELGKNLWLYTGFLWEDLIMGDPVITELLELCDTVVEGPFIQELKRGDLLWRGSSNQRIFEKGTNVSHKYKKEVMIFGT